ncbi:MAG: response regulator [Sorangiineae bacterium]|nr:response regulator [Polyangiaceae bacterium]MEB2323618.1 response regulator [Sorangiineae bacterium]
MTAPYRVLVVEDDPLFARTLARVLAHRGMVPTVATCSADAERAGAGFDVGVFDIDLPDASGVELARKLLAQGAVACAVFHSATTSEAVQLEASELGSFCHKGKGLHALHKMMLDAISDSETARRAVGAPDDLGDATRFRSGKRPKLI